METKDIKKTENHEQHDYLSTFKNFEHKIEEMFQRLWHDPFHHESASDTLFSSPLTHPPKIDVIDKDKEIQVVAELPGVEKKDLDVSITNSQLVIKAKTCHEMKEVKDDYIKQEISKSEVYRSIALPADVDDDSVVKTSFKNGVLNLTIPKNKKSYRRRIAVD